MLAPSRRPRYRWPYRYPPAIMRASAASSSGPSAGLNHHGHGVTAIPVIAVSGTGPKYMRHARPAPPYGGGLVFSLSLKRSFPTLRSIHREHVTSRRSVDGMRTAMRTTVPAPLSPGVGSAVSQTTGLSQTHN